MLNEERRRRIVEEVQRSGRAVVSELAQRFETSVMTIRRDLQVLGEHGLILRIHGGALSVQTALYADRSLTEHELLHAQEKRRIALAAVKMVKEGQSVLLDSGSTTSAIARELRTFKQLTVITNAINIASELADSAVEVILTGGMLRKNSFSLIGPLAEESLTHLKADILFMGVEGIDPQFGLSTSSMLGAVLERKMVQSVHLVVAVCDSSKFGHSSLSSIMPVTEIHRLITDRGAPAKILDELRASGIEITLV
jgi:DeoR family transcriptional regulator of aga operon